ncbi:MAG: GTP pyrophosphokinase [Planctomycetota bacterium]|jgi:ppGpp synthetase/RelA/SpoT-type nucleotidyltranferase
MNNEILYDDYLRNLKLLEKVQTGLKEALNDLRKEFHGKLPYIASPKSPECRIKRFDRICEKLSYQEGEWPHSKIIVFNPTSDVEVIVNDLIAGRIVCAAPKDVEYLTKLVRDWHGRFIEPIVETKNDRTTGYRACHIDTKIPIFEGREQIFFPVEIQLKTLLQDAWANFGHDEFYKTTDELPVVSREISLYLADTLASLDLIGQAIREEKLRKLEAPRNIQEEETLVTQRTLNYLINKIFKESMSVVELQRSVAQLKAFGLDNLASVDEIARDPRVANAITVAKAKNGLSSKITPFEIVFFGPLTMKGAQETLDREVCRMYSLTGQTCANCNGPIRNEDKEFIDNETDLDSTYLCQKCCKSKLSNCEACGILSSSKTCKSCRSKDPANEIL